MQMLFIEDIFIYVTSENGNCFMSLRETMRRKTQRTIKKAE